jgi:hypothetical protein
MEEVSQLRVLVPGEGYNQITRKEWEQNGLVIHDPDQIQFLYQGEPYPYWTNAEPDLNDFSIRFYSPPISPDINLSENVFILSAGQSETNRCITPQKVPPAQSNFQNNSIGIHQEIYQQQSLYLPQIAGEDHWLWHLFQPNQPISQEILLLQEPMHQVRIKVQVWVTPTNVEHPAQQFSATINDHVVEPVPVEGQGWQVIEFMLDPAYLNTKNKFSIQTVIFPNDLPAKIYLDWIEIEYSLPVRLENQIQTFTVRDHQSLTSTNSSSGTLVNLDKNHQILDVYSMKTAGQNLLAHQSDTFYSWIPDGQFLTVSSIQSIDNEKLTFPSQPVNYLIIAPENFHKALSPLMDLRQKQGLTTMIVSPQQIYDRNHAGTPSVDAIKEFVLSIYEHDPEGLKYLLLVGDYSYEIVNYQKFIEYVPSFFISTGQSGQIISDFPFSDLNGDLLPELSIGRIPATTPEQVTAWVEKVILYERSIPAEWNHIIAISDPSDSNFLDLSQDFLLPFKNEFQTQFVNAPGPDDIHEIFKSSYSLVAYFGHGSIDLWGREKILTIPMLSTLPESAAPPVLISFSCLNGYFIHPEKISLAESLLFHPVGGVTGIFAPTGQTLMEDHEKLLQFLQNKLQSDDHSRIGNLIYHQKGENFPEDYSVVNIFQTSIFFGDPAMLIP